MEFVQHVTGGGTVAVASPSTFVNGLEIVAGQWDAELSTHLGDEMSGPRTSTSNAGLEELTCEVIV